MSIEEKIKELEQQLEFQKAWLSVSVSFGRGNKIDESFKNTIEAAIRQFCEAKASNLELPEDTGENFTSEEVNVLKLLASAALNKKTKSVSQSKQTAPSANNEKQPEVPAAKDPNAPLMVEIVRTDNIPYTEAKLLEVGEKVRVVTFKDEHAIILTKTGAQFGIPLESVNRVTN